MKFFCNRFVKLSRPLGARLVDGKTVIMTTCDGISPLGFLEPLVRDEVWEAINTYARKPKEEHGHKEVWGTRLLGYPIGGQKFAREYLQRTISRIDMHTVNVCIQLGDLQTMLQVYKSAIIPKALHLFAADVHHNTTKSCDTFKWLSLLALALMAKTRDLLARITGKSTVPDWVLAIAHLRIRDGGLGVLNPASCAIPLYVQSITSTVRYALKGVPLKHLPDDPVSVPDVLQAFFERWDTSDNPFFVKYQAHAEKAFGCLYPDADDIINHAIHHGRRTQVAKAIKVANAADKLKALFAAVPKDVFRTCP